MSQGQGQSSGPRPVPAPYQPPSRHGFMINEDVFFLKLFLMDSTKDMVIVSGDGAEIECHRLLFGAWSDALAAMVAPGSGMSESRTGRVEMPYNSETGIRQLLRYLYGLPMTREELTCEVAVELFQTAHLYQLLELQKGLEGLISEMGVEWCTPDDILRLYFHLKEAEGLETFRWALLHIMARIRNKLQDCEGYKGLNRMEQRHLFWKLFDVDYMRNIASFPGPSQSTGIMINRESFSIQLFLMESTKDMVIVAGNGAEVKCHKLFFGAQSSPLASMAQTGRVEMSLNSEEGLNHLLRYLYGMRLTTETQILPCHVAVELFVTAQQYQLIQLQDDLEFMLTRMPVDWYEPNAILEFYFYLKERKEYAYFCEDVLRMMTSMREEIRDCDRFKGLTEEERNLLWKLLEDAQNIFVPHSFPTAPLLTSAPAPLPPAPIPVAPVVYYTPKSRKQRKDFDQWEDRLIIQKLLEMNAFQFTRGRNLWDQMANLERFRRIDRSAQSLRGRYVKHLAKKWFENDGGQGYFGITITPEKLSEIRNIEVRDHKHNNYCQDNLFG